MPRHALVTGATSLVGDFLLPRLAEAGFRVTAVSRRPAPPAVPPGIAWLTADVSAPGGGERLPPADVLFHLAPLWLLPPLLAPAASRGATRVVALGSTSRFTKARSPASGERDVAARLAAAEAALEEEGRRRGFSWTVLRPTLVYGRGRDGNVSALARFAARYRFLPVAGEGKGRRQPVHAEDVATACLAALGAPAARDRAYDLGGGSTLTWTEMAEAVFRGLGREPRLVRVPRPLLRLVLRGASRVPGLRHLTPEMADRVDADLVFDWSDARRDLGYAPREFAYPDGRAGGGEAR